MSSQIRMQADDFFHAYQVLKESTDATMSKLDKLAGKPLVSKTAFGGYPTLGPSVVCLAFSVELYMKDLHFALKDKAPHVHNILKLYTKLPKQMKREIFAHTSISQNPFATRGPIYLRKRFTGAASAYYGFLHQIKAISDGFEKWRYSYERTTLQYEEWFALALIEAVKSAADSRQPRLQGPRLLSG